MKADKRMGFHPMKIREGMAADWETRWDLDLMDFSEIGAPGAPGGGDAADYDTGIGSGPRRRFYRRPSRSAILMEVEDA